MVLEPVVSGAPRKPHVLLFPFPERGHINPLLDIAFRLSASGILSTFLMPAHLASDHGISAPVENLRLAALDLPPDTTNKLSACVGSWQETLEILGTHFPAPLRTFILSSAISCLISDSFMPWTADLASELGIPRVEMWTGSASTYVFGSSILQLTSMGLLPFKQGLLSLSLSRFIYISCLYILTSNSCPTGTQDFSLDFLPGISTSRLGHVPIHSLTNQDLSDPTQHAIFRSFAHGLPESKRVLVNSFHELEAGAIAALRAKNVNMTAIGPTLGGASICKDLVDETQLQCLRWLDRHDEKSVVYVAFGSVGFLSVEEIQEVAATLEAVGRPFLWAIHQGSATHSLPENFRPGLLPMEKGLIVSWAPQRQVLEHQSIGAFVTHCGWNSLLESLWNGVPMVGCPRVAEQNTNLWLIEQWGIGVSGVDTIMGGIGTIRRTTLTHALQLVMGEIGLGIEDLTPLNLRKKVGQMAMAAHAALTPSGSSTLAFQEFVSELIKC